MSETKEKLHYPNPAIYAKKAAEELNNVQFIDLDNGNGYLFKITNGKKWFVSGAGKICSYPINSASSMGVSRDKAHSNSALRCFGLPIIPGEHFFVTDEHKDYRNPGHEIEDAIKYANKIGYPVFCKPIDGSRGDFAEFIYSSKFLDQYIERVSNKYRAILIQRPVSGDEYRVLILDGSPMFYTKKMLPTLEGDGKSTIQSLLVKHNEGLPSGVSRFSLESLMGSLEGSGKKLTDILAIDEALALKGRSNLSATGDVEYVKLDVPEQLSTLGQKACEAIALRLGAVDVFDVSPNRDLSDLIIIEVNGNPALKAVENYGHLNIIIDIWKYMIRKLLEI